MGRKPLLKSTDGPTVSFVKDVRCMLVYNVPYPEIINKLSERYVKAKSTVQYAIRAVSEQLKEKDEEELALSRKKALLFRQEQIQRVRSTIDKQSMKALNDLILHGSSDEKIRAIDSRSKLVVNAEKVVDGIQSNIEKVKGLVQIGTNVNVTQTDAEFNITVGSREDIERGILSKLKEIRENGGGK